MMIWIRCLVGCLATVALGSVSAIAADSPSKAARGYGRDTPQTPLSVSLQSETAPATVFGYPRENPPNPLLLEAQADTAVEVRVTTATRQQSQTSTSSSSSSSSSSPSSSASSSSSMMMMMGGEIPGTAGTDYPVLDSVPDTSFSCADQSTGGYFADVEARCQVFHVCHDSRKSSFLCPNGTLFDQQFFVCNWWFNVDCSAAPNFYSLNAQIGIVPEKADSEATTASPVTPASSSASSASSPPFRGFNSPDPFVAASSIQDQQTIAAPSLDYLPPPPPPNAIDAILTSLSLDYLPPRP